MASNIPGPVLLLLATATESFIITATVPQEYLPHPPLSRVFVRLLVLQTVAFLVYKIFVYPFFFQPFRHLPTAPGGNFILGHGLTQFERPAGTSLLKWQTEIPNDGLIHSRGFFNRSILSVTDPKAIGEILVTRAYDFEKPAPLRKFLRWILGDGLILVEGDVHKFQRKNIMPVFTFRHIKELYSVFWDKSVQLAQGVAQQIAEDANTKPTDPKNATAVVEVNHWANQVTMDIIGLAAMGRDFQALKDGQDPLIVNYEEVLEPTKEKQIYFVANMMLPKWFVRRLPWKLNQRMALIVNNISDISLRLVREKKEVVKTEPEGHKDILSLLIRSNNFSDQQLVDQMLTFLAAGHETTSSAFTWSTFLLSKHPEIQEALRKEIHEHVPSPNSAIPSDVDLAAILESLPLLNGVCQETIRLYPTVPITVRNSNKDTQLVGQRIPKDTTILLCPYATNRNPHLWGPNADKFIPERWIDTDEKTGERRPNKSGGAPSNYAILTFLHGPRSCIGQGFAQAELRCLVAAFAGTFSMEMADPNEKIIPSGVVTTKPNNGMHLRLRNLGGW